VARRVCETARGAARIRWYGLIAGEEKASPTRRWFRPDGLGRRKAACVPDAARRRPRTHDFGAAARDMGCVLAVSMRRLLVAACCGGLADVYLRG